MDRLIFQRELGAAVLQALMHSLWQAAAVCAAASLVCGWLGRRRAPARYVTLVIAMAVVPLSIPLTTAWLLRQARAAESAELAILVNARVGDFVPAGANVASENARSLDESIVALRGLKPERGQGAWGTWEDHALSGLCCYGCIAVLMLVRVLRSVRGGQTLAQRCDPLTDPGVLVALGRAGQLMGLSYTPAVALCGSLNVPAVVGVLRPIVLVPVAVLTEMDMSQIEMVLMHELAHIRRHDQVFELAQRMIEALLFFNPFVWWLSSRIRAEREWCCDDLVVRAGAAPDRYAESLLRAGKIEIQSRAMPSAGRIAAAFLAATGRGSDMRERIVRLFEPRRRARMRLATRPTLVVAALCVASVLLPILAMVRVLPASLTLPAQERRLTPLPEMRSATAIGSTDEGYRVLNQWGVLHRAVGYGSTEEVRMLLEAGADPNVRTPDGWVPLHFAACLGRADVAMLLIRAGAKVNARSALGRTPLHVALGGGLPITPSRPGPREPVVRLLLNEHADPNLADKAGYQAIHVAARTTDTDGLLPDLLLAGAQVDSANRQGATALHIACSQRNVDWIHALLKRGARADVLDVQGESPLEQFAFKLEPLAHDVLSGPPPAAQELVDHGAALTLASASALGFNSFVRAELDKNPDLVNAMPRPTRYGFNLLHWSSFAGNKDLVQDLLARGANVAATATDGRTPLHAALGRRRPSIEVVRMLVGARSQVNAADKAGRRPLQLAAGFCDPAATELLCEAGADPGLTDTAGYRALDVVISKDAPRQDAEIATVKALLNHGADPNTLGPDGFAALHRAVLSGRLALTEFLLDNRADPNLPDAGGRRPLTLAASAAAVDRRLIELLISRGAEPDPQRSAPAPEPTSRPADDRK